MRWFKSSALVTSWWVRRGVLHLDERVTVADIDLVSGGLAVRGLVAIVGEHDEARLTGEVGGELVQEGVVRSWCFGRVDVVVIGCTYDCTPRLLLRLRVLGLDDEAVHRVRLA
jgi:hypothetical protein